MRVKTDILDEMEAHLKEGIDRVVSTIHLGTYDEIGLAYQAIEKWIDESNFTPTGFSYEVYFRGAESIVSEKDFVTQIYYEVE